MNSILTFGMLFVLIEKGEQEDFCLCFENFPHKSKD